MKILSLGAGMRRHPEKENVVYHDRMALPGIHIIHDLSIFPWPWKSESFNRIVAFDIMEHLPNLIKSVEECHRILAPKGILWIHTNNAKYPQAFTDPTHVHFCTSETFDFFVPGTFLCGNYGWYSPARFNKLDCHEEATELVFELEKV